MPKPIVCRRRAHSARQPSEQSQDNIQPDDAIHLNRHPVLHSGRVQCGRGGEGHCERELRKAGDRDRDAGGRREKRRCAATTRDPRNTTRIRMACRDEDELACVKAAAEETKAVRSRVFRDQWDPIQGGQCVQDSGAG